MVNLYKKRVMHQAQLLLDALPEIHSALDFGSGDGWFAHAMQHRGLIRSVTAVDVTERREQYVTPAIYDGVRLPFDDRAFELVYAFDVLHHCRDPQAALRDMVRCAERYVLIKDHVYLHPAGKWCLRIMDEIGNRRFGIACPAHYQKNWEWKPLLEKAGFRPVAIIHPAPCHRGPATLLNRLEWIGLWKRAA